MTEPTMNCCSKCFCNNSHGSGSKIGHCEKPTCPCHQTHSNWRDSWEEKKKRYPKEINIEGLEPALTSDIQEILTETLEKIEKEIVKENALTENLRVGKILSIIAASKEEVVE